MSGEEIENFFDEKGNIRIKTEWANKYKKAGYVVKTIFVILFLYIFLLGFIFEKLNELIKILISLINKIQYKIIDYHFKKTYLKDYLIPSKKEIQEYYKNTFNNF